MIFQTTTILITSHFPTDVKGEGLPGGTMRGGGSAVRFHDCTNNATMTNMRDLKDMVSTLFYHIKVHVLMSNK